METYRTVNGKRHSAVILGDLSRNGGAELYFDHAPHPIAIVERDLDDALYYLRSDVDDASRAFQSWAEAVAYLTDWAETDIAEMDDAT